MMLMNPQTRRNENAFLEQRLALHAFVLGLIRHPQDAEDIVQEVWIRYGRAIENGKPIEHIPSWCRGVARNLILHYWRARRTGRVIFDQELLDKVEQAFDEAPQAADTTEELQERLRACLSRISPDSLQLLQMKYRDRLTSESIGSKLNRTSAAVLTALSRLRKWLRNCMERPTGPISKP